MGLTPLDAEKFEFQAGFRGYDRNQVEQFRLMVVQALEGHIQEKKQLEQRIANLKERLEGFQGNEEQIRNSIVLAQKTGEDVVASARAEAEMIRARAEADCQELRNEMARLRAEREEFEYAFHGLLAGFMRRLESSNPRLGSSRSPAAEAPVERQAAQAVDLTTEMLEMLGSPDEPIEHAPPAPAAQAPEAAHMPEHSAASKRDSDFADFSAALDNISPAAGYSPAPEAPPRAVQPDRDIDEDLDVADELVSIGEATAFDEEQDWHDPQGSLHVEEAAGAVEVDAGTHGLDDGPEQIAGLEEVQGLAPPPAVEPPPAWDEVEPEPPAMPVPDEGDDVDEPFDAEDLAAGLEESSAGFGPAARYVAEPEEESIPDVFGPPQQLQPSRSAAEDDPAGQSAAYQSGAADEADEFEERQAMHKETPRSNLDEIFGGIQSAPQSEEDDEDRPYSPDY